MGRKKHTLNTEMEELNLVPIMAILVILIPVLLFAFSFNEISVQAVSAPRLGPSKAKPTDENKEKPLNLTVLITSQGFTIKKQTELAGEPEKPLYKTTYEREGVSVEDYDYAGLYMRLAKTKDAYPKEKVINIGAEMDIPWRVIAQTIDATRVRLEADTYETYDAYSKAKPKMSDGQPVDLFPGVVFVVAD